MGAVTGRRLNQKRKEFSMASGRKDYFRHSMHAHRDDKIAQLIEIGGYESLAIWWVLLELCAIEYSQTGERENFTFTKAKLRRSFGKHWRSLRKSFNFMATFSLLSLKESEQSCNFSIPNFKKYIGSYRIEDTLEEVVKSPNKKKRKEKKRNIISDCIYGDVIKNLYELHYPRKEGEFSGLKKLSAQIVSRHKYDQLEKAVKDYDTKVDEEETEKRFIKTFTSFADSWDDYVHYKTYLQE